MAHAPGVPRHAGEERAGQPWWTWLLLLLALALLFALGFVGVQFFRGLGPETASPTPPVQLVEIPRWAGQPITAVRIEAEELGLDLDEHPEANEDVEVDDVIRTEPGPGAEVQRGRVVDVWVSTGPRMVEVPQVFGQARGEAERTLERAGLNLGTVTYESSNQPAETALRTEPTAGTEVEEGSAVALVMSSGPPPTPTPTPTPPPTPTPIPTQTPTPPPTPTPTTTVVP